VSEGREREGRCHFKIFFAKIGKISEKGSMNKKKPYLCPLKFLNIKNYYACKNQINQTREKRISLLPHCCG
jgi:hypothetical protein